MRYRTEYDVRREEEAEDGDDHSGPCEEGDKPQTVLSQLDGVVEIILVVHCDSREATGS